jgi:thiol-disulfide isomerase/thioredoxin
MKTRAGLCLSMAVVLAFVVLAGAGQEGSSPSPWDKLGKPAAPLKGLQWIKGKPVEFAKGSVYVVEFWATWCPPCRTSIPHLTQLQQQFKDKGVTIIGISKESADVVEPFVKKMAEKMEYTVALDSEGQAGKAYMTAFNVTGIPHAFIIDKQGNLVWHGHPMAQMDQVLEQVVAGEFDPAAYAKKKAAEEERRAALTKLSKEYLLAVEARSEDAGAIGRQFAADCADPQMLNSFAWTILTDLPETSRDLELARQAAAKAVELTEEKNPSILDTYALALYELARQYVAQAVAYQKKAVTLAEKNEPMRAELQKPLQRYESASIK